MQKKQEKREKQKERNATGMIVVDDGDFDRKNSGRSLLECEINLIVRIFVDKRR